jgi:xanthine dehydrogenase YagR molybdenum-binding subunit
MASQNPTAATGHIGRATPRVDGRAKVTGEARYAAEFTAPDLLHGVVVSSTVARGRIVSIDTAAARSVPGVVEVMTHENRPRTAWLDYSYTDQTSPPGAPFRALYSDEIQYSGQPVALVVAEDFETARHAASLVEVAYEAEPHQTNFAVAQHQSKEPKKRRTGVEPPASPRGDFDTAFAGAEIRFEHEYLTPIAHHNPLEMHASTVIWEGDGAITVYDKTQGVQNSQAYIAWVFGLPADKVRVMSPFVGGAFGSGLRPQYQLLLAVMAARMLERSVRVVLTRQQMFTFGYRPETVQSIAIGAGRTGLLEAIKHRAVANTSRFEEYQENVVNWSGGLYRCENARHEYELAPVDLYTPIDMRAPGGGIGSFALESAMDELAHEAGVDPMDLRLLNYSDRDQNKGHVFSSKALRDCYRQGAERFGWAQRSASPRSMRDGRELVGWGMATGVWEAYQQKTSAKAALSTERLTISSAAADIGTGTYTIMTQIAAEIMGLPLDRVTAKLGDSSLPASPVEGGSWTAASLGSAVQTVCLGLREAVLKQARGMEGSPFAHAGNEDIVFAHGRIALKSDPSRSVSLSEIAAAAKDGTIEHEGSEKPSLIKNYGYARFTHSAVFAEVKVDEELGIVRATRLVNAVAAGRILNPLTARSQVMGGTAWGLSMALHEETLTDHRYGRHMNHNLAEHHVPVNADMPEVDVIFVEEHDEIVNDLGIKGLGEIGVSGTAGAIANAVFHATGWRIRNLPITPDKVLAGLARKP